VSLLDSLISEGERLTETGALGLLIINYVFAISLVTMQKAPPLSLCCRDTGRAFSRCFSRK